MHDHRASAGESAMTGPEPEPLAEKKEPRAWKVSRGPITADRYTLETARAIAALLVAPIAVLPKEPGDIVLPFKVGIGAEIGELLRLEASRIDLRSALRRYTRSAAYLYASAQPDAQRHDIDARPVEPVSEPDRITARKWFLVVQEKRKERRRHASEPKDGGQEVNDL